jgi:tail tube protein gp19
MGGTSRGFPPGHFLLELDGAPAGDLKNIQGGGAVADVISDKAGADHIVHKHVGNVRYEDIVLTCGSGLSKAFYDWVDQASGMQGGRKDGAVIVFEGGKEISRLNWSLGQITEIDFPALDAASNDSFSMTTKISPERTRSVQGAGGAAVSMPRKNVLSSSFRLTIDGLEEACRHVSRIEPISIAFKMRSQDLGGIRGYSQSELWNVDSGNLAITLTESKAKGFNDWFQDFVINGNNGPDREKNGRLELGPFSLKFGNLGIFKMTKPSNPSGAMARKAKVEMYCESIRFSASSR